MYSVESREVGKQAYPIPAGLTYAAQSKLATMAVVAVAFVGAETIKRPDLAYAQDCTSNQTTAPDGSVTFTETCTYDEGEEVQPDSSDSRPAERPSPSAGRQRRDFAGYNMGASSFTDGNGCFVTAAASAFRRATGDSSVTPRKVYQGEAIKSRWNPKQGVTRGNLFDALPDMAERFGLRVEKTGFKGVLRAVRQGDEAMILFAPGYFAGGSGHYVAVRKALPNGRVVLDDPNGKGKSGNSERAKGWSRQELLAKGALRFRVIESR